MAAHHMRRPSMLQRGHRGQASLETSSDIETSVGTPVATTPTLVQYPGPPKPLSEDGSSTTSSKPLLRRCYNCFMSQLKGLAPFLMIMVYSVMGAYIFVALERDHDTMERYRHRRQVAEARDVLRDTIYVISTSPEDMELWNRTSLIMEAIGAFETSIGFSVSDEETVWGFYNAILYAGSIYTTIGYGNIVCKTISGRITTIFYAIVGIPLTLSVLNQLGNILLRLMTHLQHIAGQIFCSICIQRRRFLRRPQSLRPGEKDVEMGMISKTGEVEPGEAVGELKAEHEHNPPVLATMFSMIGWLFFCAGVFCIWEDWDYFTSFYFFFISMSTIGFGDIVPDYPQYMIMNVGLVFVGLAMVSVTVNVVQQKLEDVYMSLLMKLLSEYLHRLSDGEDGIGANVGILQSWASNKKAKFLMPFLSKGKRKLVMQRFQEEAKAQGIELPSTLTELDPGTGLPNILSVEKKSDPAQQLEAVQQFIEKKEQELQQQRKPSLTRAPSISATSSKRVSGANLLDSLPVRHVACQTGEPAPVADTGQQTEPAPHPAPQMVGYQLREASSQTEINGDYSRIVRELPTRSSLSLLRDSGSQTLTKTTSNRLSQTFTSSWRLQDSAAQTLVSPTARRTAESQTNLPQTVERSQQHGVNLASLTSTGSQTYLERDDAFVQTYGTSTLFGSRERGSQTIFDRSESSNQTGLSFFALREAESQTTLENKTDSSAQTRPSESTTTSSQTRQSFYALRESQSQTLFQTQDAPVQTRQSFFDIRDQQSQTLGTSAASASIQTPMSYFEMRPSGSQTVYDVADESLQTVLEMDETGSQVEPETAETRVQAGQPFFHLQSAESQTRLDVSERDTQTWSSSLQVSDATVEAMVGTAQTASQTERDSRERQLQTGSSAFDMAERATQAALPKSRSSLQSIGVQTGILSRVAHMGSRGGSTDSTPSTSSAAAPTAPAMAPLFRQMSLQKIPPPFKRQSTANAQFSLGATASTSGASQQQTADERAAVMRGLRKVQAVVDNRQQQETPTRSSARSGDNLPSVRALATQFERRGQQGGQQELDLPHVPAYKRASIPRAVSPKSESGRRKSKDDDQGPSRREK